VELTGDIQEFHWHVNTIIGALDSYGKDYPELILNLFDAYENVEEKQFATYVMVTQFGYVAAPDTYQPRTLMQGVENLYKMRVQAGTWQPALEKQQISELVAISAKVEAMKVNMSQWRQGRQRGKMVLNKKNKWKFVVPKEGESKHKVHDGSDYHWCPKHGY
jgi:hypothetical protein